MHKNYIFMSLLLLIFTSVMSVTLSDTLSLWFIMEINNFIFMFYLMITLKNKKITLLFFLLQVIISFCVILSILINILTIFNNFFFWHSLIYFYSLILKVGGAPLHFWVPMMSIHLDWYPLTVLFTTQKIIPFVMLPLIKPHSFLPLTCILTSMIIPPFIMLNSSNFKKLLAYSSVNQMGWMIFLIFMNPSIWLIYLTFYSLTLILITTLIKTNKIYLINSTKTPPPMKLLFIISMMNISGTPPFSFFLIKWYSIFAIMSSPFLKITILMMLFSTLIMTYVYINMMVKISLFYKLNTKLFQMKMNHYLLNMMIFITLSAAYFFMFI